MNQASFYHAPSPLAATVFSLMVMSPLLTGQQRLSESTGVNLFNTNCTGCHGETSVEHAPSGSAIKTMTPEHIYEVITTGPMKNMAAQLSEDEKRLLAEYMGGRKLDKSDAGDAKNMPNVCATHPPVKDLAAPSWNGWGDLSNTRFQIALVSCPGHRVSDDSSAWIGIGPAEGLGDLSVGANVFANLASEVGHRREDAASQ